MSMKKRYQSKLMELLSVGLQDMRKQIIEDKMNEGEYGQSYYDFDDHLHKDNQEDDNESNARARNNKLGYITKVNTAPYNWEGPTNEAIKSIGDRVRINEPKNWAHGKSGTVVSHPFGMGYHNVQIDGEPHHATYHYKKLNDLHEAFDEDEFEIDEVTTTDSMLSFPDDWHTPVDDKHVKDLDEDPEVGMQGGVVTGDMDDDEDEDGLEDDDMDDEDGTNENSYYYPDDSSHYVGEKSTKLKSEKVHELLKRLQIRRGEY